MNRCQNVNHESRQSIVDTQWLSLIILAAIFLPLRDFRPLS